MFNHHDELLVYHNSSVLTPQKMRFPEKSLIFCMIFLIVPSTSPIYSQYSPINEKPGGGFQRAPTAAALEPAHLPSSIAR